MELVDRPDDQEKFSWRCSNGRCARKHSRMYVKTGSIFEKTKVPLAKWLHVVVLWTIETSVTNTCALTNMSVHTVIDLFQFLRDICGEKLLHYRCGHHMRDRRKLFPPQDQIPSRTSTTAESVGFWNSRYQHYPSNGIFTNGQQTSLIYIGKVIWHDWAEPNTNGKYNELWFTVRIRLCPLVSNCQILEFPVLCVLQY